MCINHGTSPLFANIGNEVRPTTSKMIMNGSNTYTPTNNYLRVTSTIANAIFLPLNKIVESSVHVCTILNICSRAPFKSVNYPNANFYADLITFLSYFNAGIESQEN